MVCARCGHANPAEARFCSSCGAPLARATTTRRRSRSPAVEAADVEDELERYLEGLPAGRRAARRPARPGVGLVVPARAAETPRSAGTRTPTSSSTTSRCPAATSQIDKDDDGYVLRDVGSLNGTYVNRERVDEARLRPRRRGADRSLPPELRARRRRARTDPWPTPRTCRSATCSTSCRDEFPDITISKIRFLESQGLVEPERTPSGYRKFYAADVERLRFVLRQQREHFLPLKVIKERLDDADADGCAPRPAVRRKRTTLRRRPKASPPARRRGKRPAKEPALFEETRRRRGAGRGPRGDARSSSTSRAPTTSPSRRSRREPDPRRARPGGRAHRRGARPARGVRARRARAPAPATGCCSTRTRSRSRAIAAGFMRHGIEPRHLRMYRAFAEREALLFEQVLLPYRRQRNPEAQARTAEALGELAGLGRRLRTVHAAPSRCGARSAAERTDADAGVRPARRRDDRRARSAARRRDRGRPSRRRACSSAC